MDNNSPNCMVRPGCTDMWNAFMVNGAEFTMGSDIPVCPCTAIEVPKQLLSYTEAKHLHKVHHKTDPDYHIDAFVHFYIDDQKFDGPREGIWNNPYSALDILSHFSGTISPDFSTYADFPDPIKRYNTYRMRAFGRWLSVNKIHVINNVRWGSEETWDYCFDGIPLNSIVAIGTVASGLRSLKNRSHFEKGFYKLIELLQPQTIIVYGSSNYSCFKSSYTKNIIIIEFPSQTSLAFSAKKEGDVHE